MIFIYASEHFHASEPRAVKDKGMSVQGEH